MTCLFDPEHTGKGKNEQENLSLKRFIKHCNCNELTKMYDDLLQLYKATGIKDWRNKVLVHNDLKTLLGIEELKLNFGPSDIEHLSEKIYELVDIIRDPRIQSDSRVILPYDQDVSSFLHKLKKAITEDKV